MSAKYKFWFDAAMMQKAAGNHETAERFFKMAQMYASDYE